MKRHSFHPTLSLKQWTAYVARSLASPASSSRFQELFPQNNTVLVDSGRSAFALIIEALGLKNKTIIFPAYVCDAFLPVLAEYNITPIFLDIDKETYQPPLSAYTEETLEKADAVALVATYGKKPHPEIIERLLKKGLLVIEDYAMRSPFLNEPIQGTARLYSLPKTLPVPDGGLAVLPKDTPLKNIPSHRFSFTYIKNTLKLLPKVAPLISHIRHASQREQTTPSWSGIRHASTLTKTILADASPKSSSGSADYTYCYPMLVSHPDHSIKLLLRNHISPERIWDRPIILNPEAQKKYGLKSDEFPITQQVVEHIICVPLWHVDDSSYERYVRDLEQILAEHSSE